MAHVLSLRDDYTGDDLRGLARSTDSAKQARRLLALSLIYDGSPRSEAARHGGVGVQTVRDWVLRFNASGADGLQDRTSPGTPPRLNAARRRALARMVDDGPTPYLHGVVRVWQGRHRLAARTGVANRGRARVFLIYPWPYPACLKKLAHS